MKNARTLAAVTAIAAAFAVGAVNAQTTPAQDQLVQPIAHQAQSKERVEIVAELSLWRQAGLEGARVSDIDYATKLQEYQRLRSGPAYLAALRKLGADASVLAGEPAHQAQ